MPGTTLVLSEFNAPSPDWYVFDARIATCDVRGPDVLLAIEQADSSVRRDLGWKADLYPRHGVRDYWAIELEAARLHMHRDPARTATAPSRSSRRTARWNRSSSRAWPDGWPACRAWRLNRVPSRHPPR